MYGNQFVHRLVGYSCKQHLHSILPIFKPLTTLNHYSSAASVTVPRCLHLLTGKSTLISQTNSFHEDRVTKDVTIWGSIKHLKNTPLPALVLGLSGLIPFVAAPTYMMCSSVFMAKICTAQMAYGATILSFLGGIRWGYSIDEQSVLRPDWINLGVSVMPSLVAWVGLLLPNPWSLFTVMCGLAGAGYYDLATYGYPPWFKGLRFVLTLVAVLSLWTTFMCSFLLKESTENISSIESEKED